MYGRKKVKSRITEKGIKIPAHKTKSGNMLQFKAWLQTLEPLQTSQQQDRNQLPGK